MTLKNSLVSVRYLSYQPKYEKIKTWTLRFPAKENLNMEKALFDWPIVLQYDVKAKYRLISRKFSDMKFFHPSVCLTNQTPRVCQIRSINQSNRTISVCLLFLFCSRVFIMISRSYQITPTNYAKNYASRIMYQSLLWTTRWPSSSQPLTNEPKILGKGLILKRIVSSYVLEHGWGCVWFYSIPSCIQCYVNCFKV